jgi:hypothetical protein
MKLEMIRNVITRKTGRGLLITKKYSPEILLITGIVGIGVSTVLACRATLKADEVLEDAKSKLDRVHRAKEMIDKVDEDKDMVKYTEDDYKKDLAVTYIQTGWNFVKLYGPSVTLGAASIACILVSHGIMKKRNLALVAAYKAVEGSFAEYRKRVIEEFGQKKDWMLRNGIKEEVVDAIEVDENGKKKKVKKTVEVQDPNGISMYAKYFDENNINWSDVPEYNLTFLKCQQQFANDLLHSRGHIFLNEIYDMLAIQRTPAGSQVGWVDGNGDSFVDFGIYNDSVTGYVNDHVNDTIAEQRRDFVNGHKNSILLDFNVDGVIYDMI